MIRMFLLSLMVFGMTACATVEGYRQRMDLLMGRTSDSILLEWGAPTAKETLSDGAEMWVYVKEWETRSGGYTSYNTVKDEITKYVDGKAVVTTIKRQVPYYVPVSISQNRCETRFIIKDDLVTQVLFEGNACVAEKLKPVEPAEK
jgi:hypothetical protein